MFAMYTLGTIFIILTGFALYAEQWGWGTTPMNLIGWVFVLFGDPQTVRTLHHLAMWYLVLFAVIHMYMVFREDIMSGESVIGTMISGIRMWKKRAAAHERPRGAARHRRWHAAARHAGASRGWARCACRSRRPPRPGRFPRDAVPEAAVDQPDGARARARHLAPAGQRAHQRHARAITPDTAVRLALYFGNEAAFWMHLQVAWDMHAAVRQLRARAVRR